MTQFASPWQYIEGMASAWFPTASLPAAAALARRVLPAAPEALIDVRSSGCRVRLAADGPTETVSSIVRDLGLTPDPAALQALSVVVETGQPVQVGDFWRGVLGYDSEDAGLVDPLRRDPALRIRTTAERRALRNRVHLDVVRPAEVVDLVNAGEPTGPYGVCHADPDGNEVDLVPGEGLGDGTVTEDWRAVFAAVACYRVAATAQQADLAVAAAALADEAGFPLLIDLRPGFVILDSGKDLWEADAHGLALDFNGLAARLQAAARAVDAAAEPNLARFVQVFLDAADVAAVRAFWMAALCYVEDPRAGVSDIVDPRRLNPVLVFQELDATDTARREQRNRMHLEVALPADEVRRRLPAVTAAGGRTVSESDHGVRLADPEGNELVLVSQEPR